MVTLYGEALLSGPQTDYKPFPHQEVRLIEALPDGDPAPPYKTIGAALSARPYGSPMDAVSPELPSQDDATIMVTEVWQRLAICESGMQGQPRWDYNGGSGFDGGLQFYPPTWTAFRPEGFPEFAYQATPYQQVQVGRLVAEAQGATAWPTCTAKLGITTGELTGE